MSAIFPVFISPDRQNWIIGMITEETVTYLCSSTKLRNALNQRFRESGTEKAVAQHYKEAARSFIDAIKQVTGKNLEAIKFTDGKGKFLTISRTSCEHNFEPTPEVESEPDSNPASRKPLDNSMSKRQAEIRARLQKLAE